MARFRPSLDLVFDPSLARTRPAPGDFFWHVLGRLRLPFASLTFVVLPLFALPPFAFLLLAPSFRASSAPIAAPTFTVSCCFLALVAHPLCLVFRRPPLRAAHSPRWPRTALEHGEMRKCIRAPFLLTLHFPSSCFGLSSGLLLASIRLALGLHFQPFCPASACLLWPPPASFENRLVQSQAGRPLFSDLGITPFLLFLRQSCPPRCKQALDVVWRFKLFWRSIRRADPAAT